MSVKLSWPAFAQAKDSLAVYWKDTPFTPASLPVDKVTLAGDTLEYIDDSIPEGAVRYYVIEALQAGENPAYSQCLCYANVEKTGPGRNTVLRGDWNFGYMDTLTAAQMFTAAGLKTALGLPTTFGGTPAVASPVWHKFAYKGKVLFMPETVLTALSTLRWSELYNAGLVYGVDGPGEAPFDLLTSGAQPPIPALVNQRRVVTVGEDRFLVRLPCLSDLPTNQYVDATKDSYLQGEWWNTIGRMVQDSAVDPVDLPRMGRRFGDLLPGAAGYTCTATPHFFSAASAIGVSNLNVSGHIARDIRIAAGIGAVHWLPVLEYLPE